MKPRWSCGAEFEARGEIPDLWNMTRPRVLQRQVMLGCEVTGSRHVPLYVLGEEGGAPLELWLDSTGCKWAEFPGAGGGDGGLGVGGVLPLSVSLRQIIVGAAF